MTVGKVAMPLHCKWTGVFIEDVSTLIQSYLDAQDDLYIETLGDRSGHHEWEIDLPMGFAAHRTCLFDTQYTNWKTFGHILGTVMPGHRPHQSS